MSDTAIDTTATEEEMVTPNAEVAAVVPRPASLEIAPAASAQDLVQRLAVIQDAANTAMTEGVDFGKIPGTDKPTLLKPGAEKLSVLFQLDVQIVNEQTWGPGDHLTVTSRATVFHAPTGTRLGYGEGVCTTREKKYAKRRQERVCPTCAKPAVIRGKAEFGGGWLCWKRKDGCGAKFPVDSPLIVSQEVGDIDNPDLPDTWNTVTKMAEKRARVDAVLAVTGASAIFTQDVEEMAPADHAAAPQEKPAPITQDQLDDLGAVFKAAGSPVEQLAAKLDQLGVDAHEDLNKRMTWLTAAQAVEVRGALAAAAPSDVFPTAPPVS